MEKPLSINRRRVYLIFFTLVFIIAAPLVIIHAKGYRLDLKDILKLSDTGGLYVSAGQSGAEIYVNKELVKKTSLIQKSIFVQDLKPGAYDIKVSKDGYQTWSKKLKVYPEIVTEARPFLIKEKPALTEIPKNITSTTTSATTSPRVVLKRNPEYDSINSIFALPAPGMVVPPKLLATSSEEVSSKKLVFEKSGGVLMAKWEGDPDAIPDYFCENVSCKSEIAVNTPSPVLSYEIFPGRDDLLVIRLKEGVYVSEIDNRSPQNIEKIVEGVGYDFRIKDGKEIYLKNGTKIYSISL